MLEALEACLVCFSAPRVWSLHLSTTRSGHQNCDVQHRFIGYTKIRCHLQLKSTTDNDQERDEDLNGFMNGLFEESMANESASNVTKDQLAKQSTPYFVKGEKATVGIGGNTGVVYDVNAVKRNLVQESVRGCKQELLVLLGSGRQQERTKQQSTNNGNVSEPPRWKSDRNDLIEERLSALVQVNPVSTTTDSNLLDGDWSFAFSSHSASTILDTSRFILSKTKRPDQYYSASQKNIPRGGPWRFRAGKTENPFRSSTRQICLENLSGDQNAHIIDETRVLGGLFRFTRRYDV